MWTFVPRINHVLLAKSQIVLPDQSKDIRNKAIKKCDRSKLVGMYTFVTIIENPLVFSRRVIGLTFPSTKPKQLSSGAPF